MANKYGKRGGNVRISGDSIIIDAPGKTSTSAPSANEGELLASVHLDAEGRIHITNEELVARVRKLHSGVVSGQGMTNAICSGGGPNSENFHCDESTGTNHTCTDSPDGTNASCSEDDDGIQGSPTETGEQ